MEIKNEQNMEQQILEVAEKLFLEKGFAGTSTTMIAKEVGCNQALVHYYFRTKEKLFSTIFEQKFRYFFKTLFQIEEMDGLPFEDKIRYLIESHFDMISINPQIPALILGELSRKKELATDLREKLRELPERFFYKLNEELQIEISRGKIRDITIFDLVFCTLSLNLSLFLLMPVVESIMNLDDSTKKLFIAHRRKQNVEFILQSLRP